jgi:hypothetical protein
MRLMFGSLTSVIAMLMIGCNAVDPGDCWPNTSGGLGGGGPIPIAAGVGATTTGDYYADAPPAEPLDYGGTPNPCMAPGSPPESACQGPSPSENRAAVVTCSAACKSKCPSPGAMIAVKFSPSEFKFRTTVKDDGQGNGGGWQVAKPNLDFGEIIWPTVINLWHCAFNIEMPLRTEFMGKISATRAANLSVEITESVASHMDYKLPSGIFCTKFIGDVDAAFKSKYPRLGAKAVKK